MKKLFCMSITFILTASASIYSKQKTENPEVSCVKIKLIFNGTALTATMYDNPTARDFILLLPLTLELKDYNSTEKISYLPKKLPLKDSPSGCIPSAGDITYYAPWGNIAIFYRDFSYSAGLIRLGRIDSGVNYLEKWTESKTVRIEMIKTDK